MKPAITPEYLSRRKARRRPKAHATDAPSLAARLLAERQQLFKAMSIIACCRLACASKLAHDDPEVMTDALEAAHDIVDESAGQLGVIQDEHEDDDSHSETQS